MLAYPKLSQLAPSVIRPIEPFGFHKLFLIVTLILCLTYVTCDSPLDDDDLTTMTMTDFMTETSVVPFSVSDVIDTDIVRPTNAEYQSSNSDSSSLSTLKQDYRPKVSSMPASTDGSKSTSKTNKVQTSIYRTHYPIDISSKPTTEQATHVSSTDYGVINACDTNQSIVVSNSPVQLKAITGPVGKCNVTITIEGGAALSTKLLESGINTTYSYSYIEMLGNETQHCAGRYALLSSNHIPCSILIKGSQFRFHFQNTEALIEIRAEHLEMNSCFENQSANGCDMTLYEKLVRQEEQSKEYKIREKIIWDTQVTSISFKVTSHLIRCDCACPQSSKCTCTLGNREWQYSCITNSGNTTNADLIDYEPTVTGVSFANTGLHHIKTDAFANLQTMKYLLLDHNNIEVLPATIFEDMLLLEVLNLCYNNLTRIASGMFDSLDEVRYLDLSHNDISTIPQDVFDFVYYNRFYLNMSSNQLTLLPNDTLTSQQIIDGTLDSSNNNIMTLPIGIFTSLDRIDGTIDISNNNIMTLPSGIFTSLQVIYGTLDISNNNLMTLPSGIFTSLGWIDGTLDISNNNLSTLPSWIFTSLGGIDGTLDISNNNLSTLPDGIFTSLRVIYGTLDISNNNLMTLPSGIFTSLGWIDGTLDISNNNHMTLPKNMFQSQVVVGIFDLSRNRLVTFPSLISQSQIGSLALCSNYLSNEVLLTLYEVWGSLDLSYNNLMMTLPSGGFTSSMRGLRFLDLSHNQLVRISDGVFYSLHNLLILNMSHNYLSALSPDCFQTLHKLKLLNLQGNGLKTNLSQILWPLFPLKVLDLSKNNVIQLHDDLFHMPENLESLDLSENSLEVIDRDALQNLGALTVLNAGRNVLLSLPSFADLVELKVLDLSNNRLHDITSETLQGLNNLQSLQLSNNNISKLQNGAFSHLHKLLFVNISHNKIQAIGSNAFPSRVYTIDLRGSNLNKVTDFSFKIFLNSSVILVDKYVICCTIKDAKCISTETQARPEYLTCNRMLPGLFIRIPMWVIALFALICNCAAFYLRSQKRQANKVQSLLILHLSVSDLLMGITMLILVSADMYYSEFFPSNVQSWRHGFACKFAGFLAMLSSEGSVFFITLISVDRLIAIKYTFGMTTKRARICVAIAWLAALFMSSLSIAASSEGSDIYSVSEVCIGIPIMRRHITKRGTVSTPILGKTVFHTVTHKILGKTVFHTVTHKSWQRSQIPVTQYLYSAQVIDDVRVNMQRIEQNATYTIDNISGSQIAPINSIVIFIGINLLCFTIVAACYLQIFLTARKTSKQAARTQTRDEEICMAKRMFALVFTDFCCWVPLCVACILAQANVIQFPPEMYVWVVGFILPINSSINPFLYVILGKMLDYYQRWKDARSARQRFEMRCRWVKVLHPTTLLVNQRVNTMAPPTLPFK